jgi:CRP-like cAMP-binding protein
MRSGRSSDPRGTDPCDLFAGYGLAQLAELEMRHERVAPGIELRAIRESQRSVRILLHGWACRHVTLQDGRRQITAFMFPGDVASHWTPLEAAEGGGVRTLTDCRVLLVRADRLADLARSDLVIAGRLTRAARADFAILSAWLANVGLRKAPERVAHLLCELHHRLELAEPSDETVDRLLPLTQQDIGDALGVTSVHVNRVVQRLRANGFIDIRKGALIVRDADGLLRLCDYRTDYLAIGAE